MRIRNLIQQIICLDYYLKKWKKIYKILLEKGGKQDPSLIQLYWVISLFNCLGKIIAKVIVQQLAFYCKAYFKLYLKQIYVQKERSIIKAISVLIYKVQESGEEKKLVGALFINVKSAFDHILRNQLLRYMIELGINKDLVV